MFRITHNKGFHITLENGYTVSVQFGPGDYCDNHDRKIGRDEEACGSKGSSNAECAVWARDGDMIPYSGWGDTVSNRSTPAEVLSLLNWAASQERETMKLFIWKGVLCDHTDGVVFAIAKNVEQAREAVLDGLTRENKAVSAYVAAEPEVHDKPYGLWGGG